jgi:UPF0042 nucleotide-binding protein
MHLVIVSGLSGSGKTVALNTLEDEDYYCIDNLPLGLLPDFVRRIMERTIQPYEHIGIGIDARSDSRDLRRFVDIIKPLREQDIDIEIIYLQADLPTLIKRFSDTRRKHPLTNKGLPLTEAIEVERNLLSEIAEHADLYIDTTYTTIYQLGDQITNQVIKREQKGLSVLFQSFGFKHGTPTDSDFVFDVRCLPNPHWQTELRPHTGLDQPVADFLSSHSDANHMFDDLVKFFEHWIPTLEADGRSYLTVAIGCTGGQHRSVYLVDRLYRHFKQQGMRVMSRHRELT